MAFQAIKQKLFGVPPQALFQAENPSLINTEFLKDVSVELHNQIIKVGDGVYTYNTPFYLNYVDISNRGVLVLLPPSQAGGKNRLVSLNPADLCDAVVEQIKTILSAENAELTDVITLSQRHWLFMGKWKSYFPNITIHIPPGHIPSQNPDWPFELMKEDFRHPLPQFEPHIHIRVVDGIRAAPVNDVEVNPKAAQNRWELLAFYPRGQLLFSGDVIGYTLAPSFATKLFGWLVGVPSRTLFDIFSIRTWVYVGNMDSYKQSLKEARVLLNEWSDDSKTLFLSIHLGLGSILFGGVKSQYDHLLSSLETRSHTPPSDWSATLSSKL